MLNKVLAVFWIFLGVLWLLKPGFLRSRMGKKTSRRVRWPALIFIFFLSMNLAGLAMQAPSWPYRILGLIAVFITAKAMLKAVFGVSQKFMGWWSELPLIYFRLWALFCLSVGIVLYYRA